MKTWNSCTEKPSVTGKKVLCLKSGDFYTAVRFGRYYFPFPFVDHYFSSELCFPDAWQEIDFPEGYTGEFKIAVNGDIENAITLAEAEVDYPEIYRDLFQMLLSSLGTLKK